MQKLLYFFLGVLIFGIFAAAAGLPPFEHAAADARPVTKDRTFFHPQGIVEMSVAPAGSGSIETHVLVQGVVEYSRLQRDGDRHLRVCDQGRCIVAECIPELAAVFVDCRGGRKGRAVRVKGIARYDGKHGWWEVHPVLSIEVGR